MTYRIEYTSKEDGKTYTLFDIEYYQEKSDYGKGGWISEIDSLPIVEGITMFLSENLNGDGFDKGQFIKDADEIQEVRGLLYERYNNKPKDDADARHFHYHVFGKVLEELLEGFSKKYATSVIRD